MIKASDRQQAVTLIDEAVAAGARQHKACAILELSPRTYQRWTREGTVSGDGRPGAERPTPANKLSAEEKQAILDVSNSPAFRSLPPSQIVPSLADEGCYLASESSFYRVLREASQQHHRGRSAAPQSKPLSTHCASGPNQVWCWDIERHEALSDRVTVRDRRDSAVAAAGDKLRAARVGERQRGWQAALTKPGHTSTVRWCGSGEQTRKV